MKGLGYLLLIAGAIGAAYFFIFFDPSVEVEPTTIMGESVGGGRVNNLGLMADRQNGLILSIGAALVGVVLIVAGGARETRAANDSPAGAVASSNAGAKRPFTYSSMGVPSRTAPGTEEMAKWHPLFRAGALGNLPDLSALLDTGTDVSIEDHSGMTALHFAAMYDQAGSLAILLKRGASKDKRNDSGETALQLAERVGARNAEAILA